MRFVLAIAVVAVSVSVEASDVYLRAGAGRERSETVLRDRECARTEPPALFGCGFEAGGEFDDATRWEIGIGVESGPRRRVELALSQRDLDLDAAANFTGVTGSQAVTARGRSRSAMVIGTLEFGSRTFITAGVGAARNEVGLVTFAFPGIAADAVTVIPGGGHTGLAWMAGIGTSIPLHSSLHLDLALRYQDSGELRTEPGLATIIRPRGTVVLDIDATRAKVESLGVVLSLRCRLR